MATYNGAQFIEAQLLSILNQKYTNIEIVIVDDCSTDTTVDILKEFNLKFSSIRLYLNARNIGVNKTFEKALSLCTGEFIAISDQDDIWSANKLDESLIAIKEYSLVYSNSELIDEFGVMLNKRKFKNTELYTGSDSRVLSLYNNIAGHTIFFRSELLKNILPIPKYCHYDWWIAFVGINDGGVKFLSDSYVMHRIHTNNVSHGMKCVSLKDGFDSLEKWTNTMLSVSNIKEPQYFIDLKSIFRYDNLILRIILFIVFQIKYSHVLFQNKRFFSRLNRARKLYLAHIPK